MKTENLISHYTISFGIYLGSEMHKDPAVRKTIGLMEPEEVDRVLRDMATKFVDSKEDDSWSFFNEMLSKMVRGRTENPVVFCVFVKEHFYGEEFKSLVGLYQDEADAIKRRDELQAFADADVKDPEFQCDPVKYEVARREVV